MTWLVTFYCLCLLCCGKTPRHPAYGITRSGRPAVVGMTVACERRLLGRSVRIAGIGRRWCDDTGGGVGPQHVDVLVATHEEALQLGRQERKVRVLP